MLKRVQIYTIKKQLTGFWHVHLDNGVELSCGDYPTLNHLGTGDWVELFYSHPNDDTFAVKSFRLLITSDIFDVIYSREKKTMSLQAYVDFKNQYLARDARGNDLVLYYDTPLIG